ncbi:MAG TPA: TonB family protein [Bacteriovoracaceae bacterium]|nr:TonB family protein [Bacteriovoracaceae bacterium]
MKGFEIDQNFNRNFMISLGIHGALILAAYLGGQIVLNVFKNNDVEIIRASVRVDVVGMPKFTIQELRDLQQNAAAVEPEVVKGEVEPEKPKVEEAPDVIKKGDIVIQEKGSEKKRSSFLNILSDYSSKKVDKKERAKGKKEGIGKKNLESLMVEGNRLSKGSALVGDFTDEASSEFASYVQSLPELIRQFWKLPTYLLDKDLRCRIKVYLSGAGQLIKLEVYESSGQAEFDSRAEKAIRDAAPFPKPSDAVGARLNSSGIILGFPL